MARNVTVFPTPKKINAHSSPFFPIFPLATSFKPAMGLEKSDVSRLVCSTVPGRQAHSRVLRQVRN